MKIVIAEKVSPATLALLQQEPGWNCVTADKIKDRAALKAELADADALIVRSAVAGGCGAAGVGSEAAGDWARGCGRGTTSITAAATHRGIVVMNTPGANAVAVAELTLGLMIAMGRAIPRANASMHQGVWDKKVAAGI